MILDMQEFAISDIWPIETKPMLFGFTIHRHEMILHKCMLLWSVIVELATA